jgi:hypothetical protein
VADITVASLGKRAEKPLIVDVNGVHVCVSSVGFDELLVMGIALGIKDGPAVGGDEMVGPPDPTHCLEPPSR